MDLRGLPLGQQIALTAEWTGRDRDVFKEIEDISGLLPRVLKAHTACVEVQGRIGADAAQDAITAELGELDTLAHDPAYRAIWYTLEAAQHAAVAQDPPDQTYAQEIATLRETLQPWGLDGTRRPYLEQVGNAQRALSALNARQRQWAEEIQVGQWKLDGLLKRWGASAERMGTLVNRRVMLDAAPVDATTLYEVRLAWVRAVGTVLDVLEGADAPEATKERLRAPVREAVRLNNERASRSAATSAPPPADAVDTPPVGGDL